MFTFSVIVTVSETEIMITGVVSVNVPLAVNFTHVNEPSVPVASPPV